MSEEVDTRSDKNPNPGFTEEDLLAIRLKNFENWFHMNEELARLLYVKSIDLLPSDALGSYFGVGVIVSLLDNSVARDIGKVLRRGDEYGAVTRLGGWQLTTEGLRYFRKHFLQKGVESLVVTEEKTIENEIVKTVVEELSPFGYTKTEIKNSINFAINNYRVSK